MKGNVQYLLAGFLGLLGAISFWIISYYIDANYSFVDVFATGHFLWFIFPEEAYILILLCCTIYNLIFGPIGGVMGFWFANKIIKAKIIPLIFSFVGGFVCSMMILILFTVVYWFMYLLSG